MGWQQVWACFSSVCPMPCCGDFWRRYYAISRMLAPGSLPFSIIISLVAFPGWGQLALVIGLFVLMELGSNMVMEPWLYGHSIGVSEVGLLVVTGFWTWLWGPLGLVLATR